jgi:uncharacterized membrane protein YccC
LRARLLNARNGDFAVRHNTEQAAHKRSVVRQRKRLFARALLHQARFPGVSPPLYSFLSLVADAEESASYDGGWRCGHRSTAVCLAICAIQLALATTPGTWATLATRSE